MLEDLVDLFIADRDFRNIILDRFPELEKHYKEDTSDGEYYFFKSIASSDYNKLKRLLLQYKDQYEYEVRNSKTGEFVEFNRLTPETGVFILYPFESIN